MQERFSKETFFEYCIDFARHFRIISFHWSGRKRFLALGTPTFALIYNIWFYCSLKFVNRTELHSKGKSNSNMKSVHSIFFISLVIILCEILASQNGKHITICFYKRWSSACKDIPAVKVMRPTVNEQGNKIIAEYNR